MPCLTAVKDHMTNEPLFWIAPGAAAIALLFARRFFTHMQRLDDGDAQMQRIARHVRVGATAYLRQQYRVMGCVFLALSAVFALLSYGIQLLNPWLPLTFLAGGFFSALAGFVGMRTATLASVRTAAAARDSLSSSLRVAFRSGAVIGLVVVGLALGNVAFWLALVTWLTPADTDGYGLLWVTTTVLTFSMGASLQALFARVGGGIFTKAADVGADLVGKVEAGIPEDDPRNPAVIADNVGDNVGDVAGMGADLFESYCSSLLAACALGAAAWVADPAAQISAVLAPLLIAGLGIILSVGGVFLVNTREDADQAALLASLSRGIDSSSVGVVLFSLPLLYLLGIPNLWGVWGAVVVGLATGLVIGRGAEYATSSSFSPTRSIARAAQGGAATEIISGLGAGMLSTALPVCAVAVGTLLAFLCGSGFQGGNLSAGLYGVAIAAVGMLSTLGITLASDAYGPIADNAGGNAQMSDMGADVRARTDALDALGNTTAATGKGFAIGSAALTALALIASYLEVVRMELLKHDNAMLELPQQIVVAVKDAGLRDFMVFYDVTLLNPVVIVALFLGAMSAFVFSGLTLRAVGRVAGLMVDEVRRQFRENPSILDGSAEPDYARCVAISTAGAQREMVAPACLAIFMPMAISLALGVAGVIGLLVGGLSAGFVLAVFFSNSGGAWDNAKKYIETGHYGGKGSAAHRAAVVGDTVGDPFKDTSGPSLNILLKLMSIIAITVAGLAVSCSPL